MMINKNIFKSILNLIIHPMAWRHLMISNIYFIKPLVLLLLFIIASAKIYSQGFDWQYSARLPFSYPTVFAGITYETEYATHTGDIRLFEGSPQCCSFNNGTGNGMSYGIAVEYWLNGLTTIYSKLNYSQLNSSFTQKSQVPRVDGSTFDSQYELDSKINYINLELGSKRRLFGTHFNIGASLLFKILVSNTNDYYEKVLNPNDYFLTDPPTQKRQLYDGNLSKISTLVLVPRLHLGYDITFGKGYYATPNFIFSFPISSMTSEGNWRMLGFSFGITLYKGIAY